MFRESFAVSGSPKTRPRAPLACGMLERHPVAAPPAQSVQATLPSKIRAASPEFVYSNGKGRWPMDRYLSFRIVPILLAGLGIYYLWIAFGSGHWTTHGAWGAVALYGAVGLFLQQSWSRYIVYALATFLSVGWALDTWQAAAAGWPHGDLADTLLALLPGILLVVACAGSSSIVFRNFRAPRPTEPS